MTLDLAIDFSHLTPQAQATTEKYINCTSSKLKTFMYQRTLSLNYKIGESFANHISGKGPVSRIHQEHFLLNNNKTDNPIKKHSKDLNRHVFKQIVKWQTSI